MSRILPGIKINLLAFIFISLEKTFYHKIKLYFCMEKTKK